MDRASEAGMIPRNHKGKGWSTDKARRWRSKPWLDFVRTLPSVIPAGKPMSMIAWPIIAAHFRYPGCGVSSKPADCLVYPLFDDMHKDLHNKGQESDWQQWEWVTTTMVAGMEHRVLVASVLADAWIRGLKVSAFDRTFCLSTPNIERVASEWARLFVDGSLRLSNIA